MQKKILTLMTVLSLAVFTLCGCGSKATSTESTEAIVTNSTESTEQSSQEEVDTTEQEEVKEEPEQITEPTEEPTPTETPEQTVEPTQETEPAETSAYTYTDLSVTMYAQQTVNVRNQPSTDGEKVGSLSTNQEVSITGQCNETGWYRIDYNGSVAYVSNSYIAAEKAEMIQQTQQTEQTASGECPYPIYQVIDEGGDKVYFYRLWNDNLGSTWAECEQDINQFWTCWNQCVGILASRHGWVYTYDGPTQTGGNVYEFGPSDETSYYIDGYMVMRARPQCCPNTSTPAEATEIAGWQ